MIKYLIIAISLTLNFIFIIFFLQRSSNVTNIYSTKIDGTPKYQERLEMPNGDVVERILEDGVLIEELVFFSNGGLKETRSYKNNQKHGDWITYYENNDTTNKKRKKQYSNYKIGKLGELVEYNYSGSIKKLSVPISISENTQMITNYYSNGQIESAGRVRKNAEGKEYKYGIWIWYDEQGFVEREGSFD